MSIVLRVLLIAVSVIAGIYSIREIRKSQVKIGNAIFWFMLTFLFLVISIFPQIIIALADLIGVESPVNLVYLIMIFLLFYKVFTLSVKVSKMEHMINILTSESAILKKEISDIKDGGKEEK